MERKEQSEKERERVEAVLDQLRKQAPLSLKQKKFCNKACVERFLKSKGDNVKKAVKQLRACLSWRDSIGTDYLIADEFSAELAEGLAYIAGHDEELRPVMIFRIKQDCQKFNSQKMFIRLMVFTLEVAIQTMPRNVEQFVILLDASFNRSASAFMNLLLATLKMIAEYYPGRLYKAFLIDPPSLFSCLWKGVRPFVYVAPLTTVVSTLDLLESTNDFDNFSSSSRLVDPSSTAKIGPSSSSRFSFTVSHHLDSLKPWYLTLTDTSSSKVGPTIPSPSSLLGPALISPLNARSNSFASPVARNPPTNINGPQMKSHFPPSTPMPQKTQKVDPSSIHHPRTPRPKPSFLQSPATFFKKDCHISRSEKSRDSFLPFLKFYRRPYDEMTYRSKMKPPLSGLISIVSSQLNRRHVSVSQRF